MKIGIIGTGNIGATLARQLTALGDDVRIANSRGPDTLTRLAEQTGATPVAPRTSQTTGRSSSLRSRSGRLRPWVRHRQLRARRCGRRGRG
jgi:siroheme synthase (precorrin-2 oxidase/ferrochelatase)